MSWNEAYLLAARQGHHLEAAGQSEQGHAIVQCVRCLGMLIGRRGGAAVADERLCHACIPLGAATA